MSSTKYDITPAQTRRPPPERDKNSKSYKLKSKSFQSNHSKINSKKKKSKSYLSIAKSNLKSTNNQSNCNKSHLITNNQYRIKITKPNPISKSILNVESIKLIKTKKNSKKIQSPKPEKISKNKNNNNNNKNSKIQSHQIFKKEQIYKNKSKLYKNQNEILENKSKLCKRRSTIKSTQSLQVLKAQEAQIRRISMKYMKQRSIRRSVCMRDICMSETVQSCMVMSTDGLFYIADGKLKEQYQNIINKMKKIKKEWSRIYSYTIWWNYKK